MGDREPKPLTDAERDRMIRETYAAVTGNGTIEKGLLWRMSSVERKLAVVMWMGGLVAAGLLTAVGGTMGLRLVGGEAAHGATAETTPARAGE